MSYTLPTSLVLQCNQEHPELLKCLIGNLGEAFVKELETSSKPYILTQFKGYLLETWKIHEPSTLIHTIAEFKAIVAKQIILNELGN